MHDNIMPTSLFTLARCKNKKLNLGWSIVSFFFCAQSLITFSCHILGFILHPFSKINPHPHQNFKESQKP